MGCLETKIMPEPGSSGCSECSTASSVCSGSLIPSPVCSFCSFGPLVGDWETESVGPTEEVAGPGGGRWWGDGLGRSGGGWWGRCNFNRRVLLHFRLGKVMTGARH